MITCRDIYFLGEAANGPYPRLEGSRQPRRGRPAVRRNAASPWRRAVEGLRDRGGPPQRRRPEGSLLPTQPINA